MRCWCCNCNQGDEEAEGKNEVHLEDFNNLYFIQDKIDVKFHYLKDTSLDN